MNASMKAEAKTRAASRLSSTPAEEAQRVTLSLPPEALDFLRTESSRTGASMANLVRRAIANEKFLKTARDQGGNILIEDSDKRLSRLVFRD